MKIKIIDNGNYSDLTSGQAYEVCAESNSFWDILDDVGGVYPVYKENDSDGVIAVEVTSEPYAPVTATIKTTLEIQSEPFDEVFINGDKYVLDKQ